MQTTVRQSKQPLMIKTPTRGSPHDQTMQEGWLEATTGGQATSPNEPLLNAWLSLNQRLSFAQKPQQQDQTMKERYFANMQRYLSQDPERFMPSSTALQKLKANLTDLIQGAVQNFIEANTTVIESPAGVRGLNTCEKKPDIFHALGSPFFFDICKRIYGVGAPKELLLKSERCYVSVPHFIQAMLASAIQYWVFEGTEVDVPAMIAARSPISDVIEDRLATCKYIHSVYESSLTRTTVGPELHEQILRESEWIFVNKKAGLNPFARNLSHKFHASLIDFFAANNIRPSGAKIGVWHDNLDRVFESALNLSPGLSPRRRPLFPLATLRCRLRP